MARFSKYERETIILWNQTDDPVSIYTFDKPLIRRLEAFREKYPELCKLDRADKEGSKSYLLEKTRLSLRLIAPMSEADKKAARERAKQQGLGSPM